MSESRLAWWQKILLDLDTIPQHRVWWDAWCHVWGGIGACFWAEVHEPALLIRGAEVQMDMRHIPVKSSHVESVAYDEGRGIFEVIFLDGSKYQYQGVTYEMWQDLARVRAHGKSVGHWLHVNLRLWPDRFPYKKVDK